ncbi:MAG: 2-C-methyl-D-erythritol 4-phosphate cytidylyltransferase [Kangiellaceae bacterium]|nr:2-C-methyl-D-erythritol 4-phosphate cytidylyltransferase [Kangiellaceae bacterium]
MPDNNLDLSSVSTSVVIIPAAGKGVRFDDDLAKQYQLIDGIPLLEHTISLFLEKKDVEKIVLVISSEDCEYQKLSCIENKNIIIIDGGEERQDSVGNALRFLYDNQLPDEIPVLVHDAVRPCLSATDFEKLMDAYSNKKGAYFLAERVSNSLKKLDLDLNVVSSIDREDVVNALTPQLAPFITLKHAYSATNIAGLKITDEVGALTNSDIEVTAVIASDLNPKVTYSRDLELVRHIFRQREL